MPTATTADDYQHGTRRAYRTHGCRCADCRAAFARTRYEPADPAGTVSLEAVPPPGDWTQHARCKSAPLSIFFPDGDRTSVAQARAICAACPVIDNCRHYALASPSIDGIWAGLTEKQRRELRRGRVA